MLPRQYAGRHHLQPRLLQTPSNGPKFQGRSARYVRFPPRVIVWQLAPVIIILFMCVQTGERTQLHALAKDRRFENTIEILSYGNNSPFLRYPISAEELSIPP